MNKKGQGALEYLLIISAAVIVAVIVIALMLGITQEGSGAADDADIGGTLDEANSLKLCIADCSALNGTLYTTPPATITSDCSEAIPKYANTCCKLFPKICSNNKPS